MNNLDLIFELVSKHFALDEKSITLFKKRLFNQELPEFYSEYFKSCPDLRKSFDITKEDRTRLDSGWTMFLDNFYSAITENSISYEEFSSSKISKDKSMMKMKNFLLDFYINDKESFSKDFSFPESMLVKRDINLIIDSKLTTRLELIGQKKLPNCDLKLVVSNNFADWFLCSTNENWSSCLNLESNFSGAYWAGLPGMIGDPNRTMVYITDGSKKMYNGIQTEKFINRSFGLLDETDKVFLLKFYPLKEMLSNFAIETIASLPLTKSFTRTKYPIVMLYHDEPINKSCFVYQDETNFYHDNSKLYLVPGEKGYYWMEKHSRKKYSKQYLHYKSGLGYLIGNNFKLTDITIKAVCNSCHKNIMSNEEVINEEISGRNFTFCTSCHPKIIKYCCNCNKKGMRHDFLTYHEDYYCVECYEELVLKNCPSCGKKMRPPDFFRGEDGIEICTDCAIRKHKVENLTRCRNCDAVTLKKSEHKYCTKCHNEMNPPEVKITMSDPNFRATLQNINLSASVTEMLNGNLVEAMRNFNVELANYVDADLGNEEDGDNDTGDDDE